MNLFSKIKKISICSLLSVGTLMSAGSTGLSAIDPRESVVCGGGLISSESSARRYAIQAIKNLGGEPVMILIPKNCTLSSGNVIVSIPQRIVFNGTPQVINNFQKIVSVGKFVSAYSSEPSNSEYRVALGYIPENASLSNEPVISYIPQVINTAGKSTLVLVPHVINLIGRPELAYTSKSETVSGIQAGVGMPQTASPAVRLSFSGTTNTQTNQARPNGPVANMSGLSHNIPMNSVRPNIFQRIAPAQTTQASPKIINMHSSPILPPNRPSSTPLNPSEIQKLIQRLQQAKANQLTKITAQNESDVAKLNQSIINSINNASSKDTNKNPQSNNLQSNLLKDSVMRASLPARCEMLLKNNSALRMVISDVTNGIEKNNQSTAATEKQTNAPANPASNVNAAQNSNNINRTNPTAPVQKSSEVNKNLASKEEALRFKGWIRSDKAQKTTHQDSSRPLNISERTVEKIKKEISNKKTVNNSIEYDDIILVDEDSQEFIETQIAPTDDAPASKK